MKISLRNVCKKYDDFYALNNVSMELDSGKFYGLLGPNGAGKTTLFNLLIGMSSMTSGEIIWENEGGRLESKNLYKHIGVVFQDSRLDNNLTVEENLVNRGAMYKLSKRDVFRKIDEFEDYLGISSIMHRKYGRLSGGQRRKVDIARALLHNPSLLLLDEPTTGLDPKSRNGLWEAIYKLNREKKMTIVLITHYLDEMKECDVLNVLIKGKINYSGSVATFIDNNATTDLFIEVNNDHCVSELNLLQYGKHKKELSMTKLLVTNLGIDEMLEILSVNYPKKMIRKFSVNYSNLEAAYLNLLSKQLGEEAYEKID